MSGELTVEEVRGLLTKTGASRFVDAMPLPAYVGAFVAGYLRARGQVTHLVDPQFSLGSFSLDVANAVLPTAYSIVSNSKSDLAILGAIKAGVTPLIVSEQPELPAARDVVICAPKWGSARKTGQVTLNGEKISITDETALVDLAESLALLTPGGVGVAVLAPNFEFAQSPHGLREKLGALGLSWDASIRLPRGVLSPLTSVVPVLCFFTKGKSDGQLFVAELTAEPKQNDGILDALLKRRRGRDVSSGMLVPRESYCGLNSLLAIERVAAISKRTGYPAYSVESLSLAVHAISKRRSPPKGATNCVFLPANGPGKAAVWNEEVKRPTEGLLIELDSKRALAPYVSKFLNTPPGRELLLSIATGSVMLRLSAASLKELELPVPPLAEQERIIAIGHRAEALNAQLIDVQAKIWSGRDGVKQGALVIEQLEQVNSASSWCSSLPYPLAAVVWSDIATKGDVFRKIESTVWMFEAFTEFFAAVLLSIYRSDSEAIDAVKAAVAKARGQSFERATFGTWKTTIEVLGKRVRETLKSSNRGRLLELAGVADGTCLSLLADLETLQVVEKGVSARNDKAHLGRLTEHQAGELYRDLKVSRGQLRGLVSDKWRDWPLVRAGESKFDGTHNTHDVELIMGNQLPFRNRKVTTRSQLVEGSLHFYDATTHRTLALLPLVKLGQAPKGKESTAHFYNRRRKDGVEYVAYEHSGESVPKVGLVPELEFLFA